MDDYDEDAELARYIVNYYPHLMTPVEARAHWVAQMESKATVVDSPRISSHLRDQAGMHTDPQVEAALSEGIPAFRSQVANRVVHEHADQVFLNRCSKCERLVQTPKAQQCLWCGNDWHSILRSGEEH